MGKQTGQLLRFQGKISEDDSCLTIMMDGTNDGLYGTILQLQQPHTYTQRRSLDQLIFHHLASFRRAIQLRLGISQYSPGYTLHTPRPIGILLQYQHSLVMVIQLYVSVNPLRLYMETYFELPSCSGKRDLEFG
jgi:hypothetical protein